MMQAKIPKLPFVINEAILLPIGTLLIVVVSLIFYVLPTWRQISANKTAITTEKDERTKLEAKYLVLSNTNEQTLESELTETRAALPELKNIPGVIAGISRLAQESNVSIDTLQLKPGKLATESAAQEISVRISIKGDIKNVSAFMNKLSQVRRIFGVQKLTGSNTGGIGDFVSALDISFYTLPLPQQLGNFSDALPEITNTKQELIKRLMQYPVYTEAIANAAISQASTAASPSASLSPVASSNPLARPTAPAARFASPSGSR